jgi:acetoin utilization protein AcuB
MFIYELISRELLPLRKDDTVQRAVTVMEDSALYHYPIVDEKSGVMVGEASLDHLRNTANPGEFNLNEGDSFEHFLRGTDHILDAAKSMLLLNRSMLPVLDKSGEYIGLVTKTVLIDAVTKLLNLREHGSVIMIEMHPRDYMLSDVIRIIEAEGARILTLTIQGADSINERLRISVKLNLDDLARVGSALRRYGYFITSESNTDLTDAELSDRADAFLKFIDI